MTRRKIYYKITNDSLCSFMLDIFSQQMEGITVQYKQNEWVKANIEGSKLLIFDTLFAAIAYNSSHSIEGRLFECYAKGVIKNWPIVYNYAKNRRTVENAVKDYDQLRKSHKKIPTRGLRLIPDHTVFADKVMLLKEIK